MSITLKITSSVKLTDPIVGVAINQQKISTDTEGTSVITGTATGGSTITLVDTAVNFVSAGLVVGSAVTRTLGGGSVVTSISTTTNLNDTLNFLALSGGNSFVAGNTYSISTTLNLNFTTETYELPAAATTWTKLNKGDIGRIRDIFIILTSVVQAENIDILITNVANPNSPILPKTFSMRDEFIATTNFDSDQDIWIRNPGADVAVLLAIIGGENI